MTRSVVPRRALVRWMIPFYALMAAAMLPWVAYLAWTLPARNVAAHYRLAWVGFDLLLCAALARTAYLAWRRSPFVVNIASATAALLVVDAWFDVTTSPGGDDLMLSVVLALLVELPLAVLSLLLAARAQIEIARTGAVRQHPRVLRWMAAGHAGRRGGRRRRQAGRQSLAGGRRRRSTLRPPRSWRRVPRSQRRSRWRPTRAAWPRPPRERHRKTGGTFRLNERPRSGGREVNAVSSVPSTESPGWNRPRGHGPRDFPARRAPLEPRPAAAAPDARRRPCSRDPSRWSGGRRPGRCCPCRPAAVRLPARA